MCEHWINMDQDKEQSSEHGSKKFLAQLRDY
jgi:hypothetical protein